MTRFLRSLALAALALAFLPAPAQAGLFHRARRAARHSACANGTCAGQAYTSRTVTRSVAYGPAVLPMEAYAPQGPVVTPQAPAKVVPAPQAP